MSGLINAIGRGLSQAGYAAGDLYARQSMAEQAAQQQSERDARLAELQAIGDARKIRMGEESAERQRVQQVQRIDAAAEGIATEAIGEKRGLINSGIADKSAWTPEQQAAVDQSLDADKKAILGDQKTRTKAAIKTGDLSIKDAEAIDRDERRIDATNRSTDAREKAADRRDETQRYIAELNNATAEKRVNAMLARIGAGDKDKGAGEVLKFLDGARKELASDAQNLRQLYKTEIDGKYGKQAAAIAEQYKPKFDAIEAKRAAIDADYNQVRERVGLAPRPTATPAAPKPTDPAKPAAAPQGLPQGSRQIGTSGGKPVFETPDGKRFIQK